MKIVICEDDEVQLQKIHTIIANYAMMEDNGMTVVLATTDPEEVLSFIDQEQADCYFLDIDLENKITGLLLGEAIRKKDPLCSIVFVTTHAEMTYLTFMYKIAALDFIIKDQTEMLQIRILTTLQEVHRKYIQIGQQDKVTSKIQIKIEGQIRNIDIDEIYFFEASPTLHKIIAHLENEHLEFYGRLKDYEGVHETLFRCHKSFIVNQSKIKSIDYKSRIIYLENEETCLASARLIKGLKK